MTMHFPYRLMSLQQPALALGGRWVRPQPVIPLSVIGPSNTRLVEGKLDTGADDTAFSERLAARIGVDLTNAPKGEFQSASAGVVSVRYARVTMRLARMNKRREWSAWVAFTAAPLRQGLLGFGGFLQFFTATFHGDLEEVELAVNRLYPGT
jgi:hypothetical protein